MKAARLRCPVLVRNGLVLGVLLIGAAGGVAADAGSKLDVATALSQLGEPTTGAAAARRLTAAGPETVELLVAVLHLRAASEPELTRLQRAQVNAAAALRDSGPSAAAAAPALLELIEMPPPLDCAAIEALAYIADPADVVARLAVGVRAPDQGQRLIAVRRLACLDGKEPAAVPLLVTAMKDAAEPVRREAVLALALSGAAADAAAPVVLDLAQQDELVVRAAALATLRRLRVSPAAAIPAVLRNLPDLAVAAADALAAVTPEAVALLRARLADPEPDVRRGAAEALGRLGKRAVNAREALIEHLDDADEGVRRAAARALAKVGRSQALLEQVAARARSVDVSARRHAMAAMAELTLDCCANRPAEVPQTLLAGLADADATVRGAAIVGLEGPAFQGASGAGKRAVAKLLHLGRDPNPLVRAAALRALGRIRPTTRALPVLMRGLHDSNPGVRDAAAGALQQVPNAVRRLATVLGDNDVDAARRAAEILAASASPCDPRASRKVVTALARATASPDGPLREAAARAFDEWGGCAADAVPVLMESLRARPAAARIEALVALSRIMPIASADAAIIFRLVGQDTDAEVRVVAALNAGRLGAGAVPVLVAALGDRDARVAAAAQQALFAVGAPARPALERAARGRDSMRARRASAALDWESGFGGVALASAGPRLVAPRDRAVPATAADLADTLRALRIESTQPDVPQMGVVPAAIRPLLRRFKQQLLSRVTQMLNSAARFDIDLGAVVMQLRAEVGCHDAVAECAESPLFGTVERIDLQRLAGAADRLVLTTELRVPCGADASLYLFQWAGDGWQSDAAFESAEYDDISGAVMGLRFDPLPSSTGEPILLLAGVHPSCRSNARALELGVHRLEPGVEQLEPIAGVVRRAYSAGDRNYRFEVGVDRFALSYEVPSLSAEKPMRRQVERYVMMDGQVVQLRSLAPDDLGFVEEWVSSDWPLAALSVDPKGHKLAQWHRTLTLLLGAEAWSVVATSEGHGVVRLNFSRRLPAQSVDERIEWGSIYVTVGRRGGAPFVQSVDIEPPAVPQAR